MKKKIVIWMTVVLSFSLNACSSFMAFSTPTATPTPSATPTFTLTPSPTVTPSLTPSATPTLTPTPTQIPISDYQLLMTLEDIGTIDLRTIVFSPDGLLLASGSSDGLVRIWDVKESKLVYKLDHKINVSGPRITSALAFSPDGSILAASSWNINKILLWDAEDESITLSKSIDTLDLRNNWPDYLEFSPDGKLLLNVGEAVELREMPEGTLQYYVDPEKHIYDSDFSSDGQFIAVSTSDDNDILILQAKDGVLVHHLKQRDGNWYFNIVNVAFADNGLELAATDKYKVNIWDLQTEKILHSFQAETEHELFNGLFYSPDDKFLIAYSFIRMYGRQKVYVWNTQDKSLVRVISGGDYSCIAMSPNGELLVIGTISGKILIFGVPDK